MGSWTHQDGEPMLSCAREAAFKPAREIAAEAGLSLTEAPKAQVVRILEGGGGFQLEYSPDCRLSLRTRSSGGLEVVPHASCGHPMAGFRVVESTMERDGDALTADARGYFFFFGRSCQMHWSSRWVRTSGGSP